MNNKLIFSRGNSKLKGIPSLSFLAGYACPFSNECKAHVDLETRKLVDGPNQIYRCFSASQEVLFPNVFKQRKDNFDLIRSLKTKEEMVKLLQDSLPNPKKKIIRLHVSGDFFNQTYFDAWLEVAKNNPGLLFYAYTKSLSFWVNRLNEIPANLKLTASKGGRLDHLIPQYGLKFTQVVSSVDEAMMMGLEIDHDDSNAYAKDKNFVILIHGTQKKGSQMGKYQAKLRKQGINGYNRPSKTKNPFRKFVPSVAA